MRTTQIFAAIATLMATSSALPCSCVLHGDLTEEQQIEREFADADAVIVAKVMSTKLSLQPEDTSGEYWVEDALFVVSQVLKGPHKLGDTVSVRSLVGGGSCGRSARNDPPWLEVGSDSPGASGPAIVTAAVFSDQWLIYGRGDEPYELSSCSRSSPMDVGGESDAEYIRKTVLKPNNEDASNKRFQPTLGNPRAAEARR